MAKRGESNLASERRGNDRFPIESDLRYKLVEGGAEPGLGRTVNMSSSGILFTIEGRLVDGERVELSVDWPAQLNESCGLKLVALGRIVRSGPQTAAIQIEKYDFRTRAVAGISARSLTA